jgi:hypothetical protein
MRTDGKFISDLRAEISDSQKRRTGYVKTKLVFIVGLLGIGSLSSLKDVFRTAELLYLIPIISFVFDLYILGEDFGIKRAGRFIASSPTVPAEEKLWEKAVEKNRDLLSFFAGPISTLVAASAAAVGIHFYSSLSSQLLLPWSILSILIVLFPLGNKPFRDRKLLEFEKYLCAKHKDHDVQSGG